MLEKLFSLKAVGTTPKREVIAGLTTFMTMAYIVGVHPSMLAMSGMDQGAVFVATCLAAALGTLIMGLFANYPVALAPGMGLNAFFTFGVVLGMGHPWQTALGAVFWSGVIFFAMSVFKIREWIINSIPGSLKTGITTGIGLFLIMIGLKNAGVVVSNEATLVSLGDVRSAEVLLFFMGLALITALHYRNLLGSVMIGMLVATLAAAFTGHVEYAGIFSAPPSLAPTFLQLDIMGALSRDLVLVIFAFLFVDLFDTSGTLIAVAKKGDLLDEDEKLPRLGKALMADSTASITGSLMGTSTTTTFIESGAGIVAGGRTGLTAVTVALCFLACLFLSPLFTMIPAFVSASALVFVGMLMVGTFGEIDWSDVTESVPVALAAIMMPLTFSIAEGIAVGFISYATIKLLTGKGASVPIGVYLIAALSIAKYAFAP